MDANAPRRGGPFRGAVAIGCAVVGLVTLVAVASGGGLPGGGIAERRPSEGARDLAFSLFLVVMLIALVAVPVMLSFFGRYDATRRQSKRVGAGRSLLTFVVSIVLIAIIVRAVSRSDGGVRSPLLEAGQGDSGAAGAAAGGYEPEFAVWPVVAIVTLAVVALVAWWLALRGRRRALGPPDETPREALADVLAATLDDLRSERDPRRAVIGAYARMERSLAAAGWPRHDAEAPEEYLERVLAAAAVSSRAAARLTALFAWARFSVHDVRPEMKEEAIETLEELQDELAAAEAMRQAEPAGSPA
jgi:4-amino-4-deoxy-L-arabinose transferase-like glycosyltransferase